MPKSDDNEDNSATHKRRYHVPRDQFRIGARMQLCSLPRHEYNMFNITSEAEYEHIMVLQFNEDTGIDEQSMIPMRFNGCF
jgi:hypothetical protein